MSCVVILAIFSKEAAGRFLLIRPLLLLPGTPGCGDFCRKLMGDSPLRWVSPFFPSLHPQQIPSTVGEGLLVVTVFLKISGGQARLFEQCPIIALVPPAFLGGTVGTSCPPFVERESISIVGGGPLFFHSHLNQARCHHPAPRRSWTI